MTFQPPSNLYAVGVGTRPENVEVPHYDKRAPTAQDILYPIGKHWIYLNNAEYVLLGLTSAQGVTSATWSVVTTLTGAVTTLTASSGGAISPSSGNINILGTANQVTTAGAGSTITLTTPAVFIAPGSIASTTTLVSGTGITATTGNIVASTGNITSTLGSVGAATTVTAGTSITATLGAITATNGNLVLGTAGNKIVSTSVATTIAAGANSFGTVTLVGGTATVSTTAVTANSIIMLTRQTVGATGAAALGMLTIGTIVGATSFVINSWSAADATALAATDVSNIGWMIIN